MAVNTVAYFLQNPPAIDGLALGSQVGDQSAMQPEPQPAILWGQGTPDGDRAPFTSVNKGSLYMSTNQTDDLHVLYQKVDEGSADTDWILVSNGTQVAQWGGLFDISASDSEQVVFHAVAEILITEIGLVWNEATNSTVMTGDIAIGVASAGQQIVATVVFPISKASGSYTALTIVDGQVSAGESVFVSIDQAASAPGTFFVVAKYNLV